MRKTVTELRPLSTSNLLKYYKAERDRYYRVYANSICSCCGEFMWDLYPENYPNEKEKLDSHFEYLQLIKSVLNTRDHINNDNGTRNNSRQTIRRGNWIR